KSFSGKTQTDLVQDDKVNVMISSKSIVNNWLGFCYQ
ncbi:hypothetical protein GWI33_003462, partial [Rhynchophorus ferrugineus]